MKNRPHGRVARVVVAGLHRDGYIPAMQAKIYALWALFLPVRAKRGPRLG
jgi:hypothetical protein